MRLTLLVMAVLASSCALRPRYSDFVSSKTAGKDITFVVTDAATNAPVPGAKIEVSELRNKVSVTTGADGTFKLPVEKKYLEENPVFVVTLPKGFEEYRLSVAPLAVSPVEGTGSAPQGPPAPALEPVDAGMPASNG